ncbi:MAG: secretion protein HlyD [Oceanospirillaceae bacterium]|nr:secretion protein HlyD [Oceanospirillaceae bacterium]
MSVTRRLRAHLKWLLPLAFILLAILLFRGMQSSRPQPPAQPVSERSWSVRAIAAQPERLSAEIELYGSVETPQMASLSAALEADLVSLEALEGEYVSAGQQLAQLDDREVVIDIRKQHAQINTIEAQIQAEQVRYRSDRADLSVQQELVQLKQQDLKRYQNLAQRNMVSQQQIDTARTALQQQRLNLSALQSAIDDHPNRLAQLEAQRDQAQATLDELELDLERTQVRAPYDARIAATQAAVGDRVRSGDTLIELYSLDRLEVRAQIPERLLAQLRPSLAQGSAVQATATIDGTLRTLTLSRLGATVSTGRAGVDGFFGFTDDLPPPEPGRSMALQLGLPPVDGVFALPPTALYGTDRIYRIVDSRLEPVVVTTVGQRRSETGQQQVLVRGRDLAAGDRVITTQLPNAIGGLLVEVAE